MPETIQMLIDIKELSRRLSVPKNSLHQKVYQRNIPFIKIGRSLRFDYDEVIRSMTHYAKSEGLHADDWKTVRGA